MNIYHLQDFHANMILPYKCVCGNLTKQRYKKTSRTHISWRRVYFFGSLYLITSLCLIFLIVYTTKFFLFCCFCFMCFHRHLLVSFLLFLYALWIDKKKWSRNKEQEVVNEEALRSTACKTGIMVVKQIAEDIKMEMVKRQKKWFLNWFQKYLFIWKYLYFNDAASEYHSTP